MFKEHTMELQIFQVYCRRLMAQGNGKAGEFRRRPCSGKSQNEFMKEDFVRLGGCNNIRVALDIVSAVFDGDAMTMGLGLGMLLWLMHQGAFVLFQENRRWRSVSEESVVVSSSIGTESDIAITSHGLKCRYCVSRLQTASIGPGWYRAP